VIVVINPHVIDVRMDSNLLIIAAFKITAIYLVVYNVLIFHLARYVIHFLIFLLMDYAYQLVLCSIAKFV